MNPEQMPQLSPHPVVAAARGWIGTPYLHQAAAKGAGCDCLGLVRGIWCEVMGAEPAHVPPYTSDWDEVEGAEVLWQAATAHLHPKAMAAMAPGDVILFRMRAGSVAKHLGIVSDTGTAPRFVHAYCGHGVIESPLSAPWARRIVAVFSFAQGGL
jgi:NlpC/P60 family putative phage cell wall peptidase